MSHDRFGAAMSAILMRDPQTLATAWVQGLRLDPTCRPVEVLDELEALGPPLLEALADALGCGPPLLAADHFRAVVRELSLVGGQLASRGASPSVLARLLPGLTDCLVAEVSAAGLEPAWRSLTVGLGAVVLETYCLGLIARERAVLSELLERHTPIVRLPGDVPALIVVGSPSRQTLSMLLGRLLLEVARMGADVLLVDFSNAPSLDRAVLGVIEELLDHRKLQDRQVVVTALEREVQRELRTRLEAWDNVTFCETWAEGLALVAH
jgi:anti-anti-sigma regulatory factor